MRQALNGLPLREREVVERRFGFQGEPRTLDAIGAELGLTRERVSPLVPRAFKRIEQELAA